MTLNIISLVLLLLLMATIMAYGGDLFHEGEQ